MRHSKRLTTFNRGIGSPWWAENKENKIGLNKSYSVIIILFHIFQNWSVILYKTFIRNVTKYLIFSSITGYICPSIGSNNVVIYGQIKIYNGTIISH